MGSVAVKTRSERWATSNAIALEDAAAAAVVDGRRDGPAAALDDAPADARELTLDGRSDIDDISKTLREG